jgi:hypothetical protein
MRDGSGRAKRVGLGQAKPWVVRRISQRTREYCRLNEIGPVGEGEIEAPSAARDASHQEFGYRDDLADVGNCLRPGCVVDDTFVQSADQRYQVRISRHA